MLLQPAHLAVDLAEQALDGDVAVDTAVAQRLEHRADDPPHLEQRLRGRVGLELRGDVGECGKVLRDLLAANPAEQRELEARTHPAR